MKIESVLMRLNIPDHEVAIGISRFILAGRNIGIDDDILIAVIINKYGVFA